MPRRGISGTVEVFCKTECFHNEKGTCKHYIAGSLLGAPWDWAPECPYWARPMSGHGMDPVANGPRTVGESLYRL